MSLARRNVRLEDAPRDITSKTISEECCCYEEKDAGTQTSRNPPKAQLWALDVLEHGIGLTV